MPRQSRFAVCFSRRLFLLSRASRRVDALVMPGAFRGLYITCGSKAFFVFFVSLEMKSSSRESSQGVWMVVPRRGPAYPAWNGVSSRRPFLVICDDGVGGVAERRGVGLCVSACGDSVNTRCNSSVGLNTWARVTKRILGGWQLLGGGCVQLTMIKAVRTCSCRR